MTKLELMDVPVPPDPDFVTLVRTEIAAARRRALETLCQPVNKRNRLGTGNLDEKSVRGAYALYQDGYSLRALAEMLWEKHGYKSATSCYNSLRSAFRVRGLKTRSVGAAMVQYHRRRRLTETTEKAISRHF